MGDNLLLAIGAGLIGATIGCFLIGSLSPATWIAKAFGKNVRDAGSGNPGATNAGRVLGVKWGVLVGVLDVLKGLVPCWFLMQTFGSTFAAVGGVFVVLGHVFSPFLRGRGGKGVATTLGVILALSPWLGLAVVVVFAALIGLLKRVGEASVVTAVALGGLGVLIATGAVEWARMTQPIGVCLVVLCLIILGRHHSNIARAWDRLSGR